MSERIDVNAAFDPELRQAQKDMDDYVNSRPETDEGVVDVLETQGTYDDAIDRAIAADPRLRRMAMLANEIREIANEKNITPENDAQLDRMYNDKQDKLAELLQEYQDSESTPAIESKDDVIDRIINRTVDAPAEKISANEQSQETPKADTAPEAQSEGKKEADSNDTVDDQSNDNANESSTEAPEQEEASVETGADEEEPKKSEKTSDDEFDQNDMAELRKKLDTEDAKEEYKPKHRAEFADEDTPLFDAVKNDLGQSEEVARENESQEEFKARQPGRHSSAADRMRVIAGGGSPSAESEPSATDRMRQIANGGSEEESSEETPRRGRLRRLRDAATPVGLSAEAAAWAANREYRRNNAEHSRGGRARKLGWFAAGLVAGGAITYLRFKGHDVPESGTHGALDPGDGLGNIPPVDGTGTGPEAPVQEVIKSIRVNPGDGEIKVTQNILDQMGIHVNAADAQRIGEHAHVDLLVGDRNYDDTGSTLNRVGSGPGVYSIRPGSVEALVQSAKDLGLDR